MDNRRVTMKVTYTRNAKVIGIITTSEFMESFHKTNKTIRRISKYIRKQLKAGLIKEITPSCQKIVFTDGTVLTDSQYKDSVSHLFDSDIVKGKETIKRMLVVYVLGRYLGLYQRNAKKEMRKYEDLSKMKYIPGTAVIKNKGLFYKDRFVKINTADRTIMFDTLYGYHTLNFVTSLKGELIDEKQNESKKKALSGNYNDPQKVFVVAVDVPFKQAYPISDVKSQDWNRTKSDRCVMNDGTKLASTEEMNALCDDIKGLVDVLGKDVKRPIICEEDPSKQRKRRSPQRRKDRLEWKRKHAKLEVESKKMARAIVDDAKSTHSLLCIDSVKTGQSLGTYGQDHVLPALQTICENEGVPFYVVPCANTSRRCSSCGYISKDNRKTTEEFECVQCGHEADAQVNAAKNIAHQGERLLNAQVPFGNYSKRNVDKLIEEWTAYYLFVEVNPDKSHFTMKDFKTYIKKQAPVS